MIRNNASLIFVQYKIDHFLGKNFLIIKKNHYETKKIIEHTSGFSKCYQNECLFSYAG